MNDIEHRVLSKYLKQYKWSNVFQMMRNNRKKPLECTDDFKNRLVLISGATSGIGYHTARDVSDAARGRCNGWARLRLKVGADRTAP